MYCFSKKKLYIYSCKKNISQNKISYLVTIRVPRASLFHIYSKARAVLLLVRTETFLTNHSVERAKPREPI